MLRACGTAIHRPVRRSFPDLRGSQPAKACATRNQGCTNSLHWPARKYRRYHPHFRLRSEINSPCGHLAQRSPSYCRVTKAIDRGGTDSATAAPPRRRPGPAPSPLRSCATRRTATSPQRSPVPATPSIAWSAIAGWLRASVLQRTQNGHIPNVRAAPSITPARANDAIRCPCCRR